MKTVTFRLYFKVIFKQSEFEICFITFLFDEGVSLKTLDFFYEYFDSSATL